MPRFRQHLVINVATLSLIEIARQRAAMAKDPALAWDWGRYAINVGAGAVAGALPDILEPSLGNPNHRGFCHSLSAALLVWRLMSGKHTAALPADTKHALNAIAAGYSAHLLADLFFSRAKGMGLLHAGM